MLRNALFYGICHLFNIGDVCVSQLARIQTDSVASRLKEIYPDVHLEIGKLCIK